MTKELFIKGAREHNLKNFDIRIPRDKMIVVTGLSGSGKSSLAFDTIYAEGQRRYIESLSSYARQFLGQMEKPDVDLIEGLSPAISIDQKTTNKNPRSTVGTVTEIYDYLRLMYARIGIPHCPICGKEIKQQTIDQIVDQILELPEGTRIQILAPVIRGKKGEHEKVILRIKKEGFVRVRIDGETYNLSDDEEIKINKTQKHNIEIVVDRIIVKEGIESRLTESTETALNHGEGLVIVHIIDGEDLLFSSKFACPEHGISIEELEPRTFSFNSPFGACTKCNGLGFTQNIDADRIIVDRSLSINQGALGSIFSSMEEGGYYYNIVKALADHHKVSLNDKLEDMPEEFLRELLYGTGEKKLNYEYASKTGSYKSFSHQSFEGVIPNLERRYRETYSNYIKERIESYMSQVTCDSCKGRKLKDEVLGVTVGGKNIAEFTDLSILEALNYMKELQLTEKEEMIAAQIIKEINSRLGFLVDVGLDYLTLARSSGSLSGGESQRIRLATQIGSSLVGVLYILDEPSIGLHQKDNEKLIKTLRRLTDLGNTLIIVEHDEDTMYKADQVIDIGPGAGIHGGELVAQGTIEDIKKCKRSITGQYLSGVRKIEIPKTRRKLNGKAIKIIGGAENNLKNIDVEFPLGVFTCVTGVSGSGKSSLVNEILYKSLAVHVNRSRVKPGKHEKITGIEFIDKVVDIDQAPIGRTPRSNPATYTGVLTPIRDLFASLNESKAKGYGKGRFSFNVKGGRCEACKGKRYNRETLEVRYKGKNIYEVLEMTVEEAVDFFKNIPTIHSKLKTLYEVGLGYIKLGQPSTQLSGGEAQRIKLASELSKRSTGKTIYILDEPTTGLHFEDVNKLIEVLNKLVDGGNTVVVIEHNLDVIKFCDYIIDLGPDGGNKGGSVVTKGTPEEVAEVAQSYTGQFLKKLFER